MTDVSYTEAVETDAADPGPLRRRARAFVQRFIDERSNILAENAMLKILAGGAFAGTLVLSATLVVQADKVRTVIVPFGAGAVDLSLVGDEPSTEYLTALGRNVVSLSGTFTKATVEAQHRELLRLVHPSVYGSVRDEWRGVVSALTKYSEVSFATYVDPQREIVFRPNVMEIPVTRARFVAGDPTVESGVVKIDYKIDQGRFWLLRVEFFKPGQQADAGDKK